MLHLDNLTMGDLCTESVISTSVDTLINEAVVRTYRRCVETDPHSTIAPARAGHYDAALCAATILNDHRTFINFAMSDMKDEYDDVMRESRGECSPEDRRYFRAYARTMRDLIETIERVEYLRPTSFRD